jgi:hypothetical protein
VPPADLLEQFVFLRSFGLRRCGSTVGALNAIF